MKVTMHPHWRAVPRRSGPRTMPGPDDRITVWHISQRIDGTGDQAIAAGQIVPELAGRPVRGIDCPQGGDEAG